MGIFDFLTGKTKLQKPQLDRLFAMSTAAVTLDTQLGLTSVGKAAISFKPFSSRRFRESGQDLGAMLSRRARSSARPFPSRPTSTATSGP